jgi:hypothetical protein
MTMDKILSQSTPTPEKINSKRHKKERPPTGITVIFKLKDRPLAEFLRDNRLNADGLELLAGVNFSGAGDNSKLKDYMVRISNLRRGRLKHHLVVDIYIPPKTNRSGEVEPHQAIAQDGNYYYGVVLNLVTGEIDEEIKDKLITKAKTE